jgi:hypothetical protein
MFFREAMKSSQVSDPEGNASNESADVKASKQDIRDVCYTTIIFICIVIAIVTAAVSVVWQGVQELLALG